MSTLEFLKSVDTVFDEAAKILNLPYGLANKIKLANSTYTVRFGVRLKGKIFTFTGYRSVHSEHMEPVKGGIRYASNACLLYTSPSPRDLSTSRMPSSA